ncbi:hypothetical protein R6Q59_001641 [Mikania micrantha]
MEDHGQDCHGCWHACMKIDRLLISRHAIEVAELTLAKDGWPEYHDGKSGWYIRKQTRYHQTWSIAGIWWQK